MDLGDSGTLHHTCFVVRDVERTASELAHSLGLGPWNIWTIDVRSGTVRGRDAAYTFRVAIAAVGGSNFELVSPVAGETVYDEHLRTHGEGFHHTCILYATREALSENRARLVGQGRKMVQSGDLGALGEFCYLEMPETRSILELLYLTELPPPEKTIA